MASFILLYFAFLFCILIGCIVVAFHLLRYSLNRKIALRTTFVFIMVTTILVLVNLYFFAAIPLEEVSSGMF